MNYKSRFKEILRGELGITGVEFSRLFGIGYDYYRKCTQNKSRKKSGRKDEVNWLRVFVIGYELGKEKGMSECEKKSSNAKGVK